jgi:hypothetical protein
MTSIGLFLRLAAATIALLAPLLASAELHGNRRVQIAPGFVCLVELLPSGRCPITSVVPGTMQTVTQAQSVNLTECNDNSGGSLIGSDRLTRADWAFKRNDENSISYTFALPDPIRGDVSLVLEETYGILRDMAGTSVKDFESFSLPIFVSSSSTSIDLNFHLINAQVTDIATNPNVSADCIITFQVDAGTSNSWNSFVVDRNTAISRLAESNGDCPAGAETLSHIGPEWSFYTANLGVGCTFGIDLIVRDGAATFDNIVIISAGDGTAGTTVYDFEL